MGDFLEYPEYERKTSLRRKAAAVRRRRQNRIFIGICIIVSVLGILAAILVFNTVSGSTKALLQLKGTWVYDTYTQYEFDGKGSGCMCLEALHYEYTYAVSGDELKLDFKDGSVRDCVYTFSIENDTLTITGGEGTVGGTYQLNRQD